MNGGDGHPQTPFQEAISLITIVAILVGVGAYVAALKNVPLLSPALFWVAVQVYLFVSGTDALAGQPGANVSRCRGRGYDVLHFHDTASLLAGRSIQPRRNRQLASKGFEAIAKNEGETMTSSRLIEHYSAIARKSTALILNLEVVMQTVAEHKVSNDFQSARELWN
jgi:hypothetical protein